MTKKALESALDSIPSLSVKELEEVAHQVNGRLSWKKEASVLVGTGDEEILYRVMSDVLGEYGVHRKMKYSVFVRRSRDYKMFMEKSAMVFDFTKEFFPGVLKNQKPKLYTILVRIVTTHIKEMRIGESRKTLPMSMHTLITFLDQAPELIHSAFPGYMEVGLLSVLTSEKPFTADRL